MTTEEEIARLDRELAQVRADVAALDRITERVRVLADRVTELTAVRSASAGSTSWFDVGPDRAGVELTALSRWVSHVLMRYRVGSDALTDCWRRHPAAVEALLALHSAWNAAYRNPTGRADAAVDWHIRLLPGTVGVLRDELRACSASSHEPGGEVERYRRSHPRTVPDEEELHGYATRWATNRDDETL